MYSIAKYTIKHKQPECRSAFTYCEDEPPSRIVFGKSKINMAYGNYSPQYSIHIAKRICDGSWPPSQYTWTHVQQNENSWKSTV